MQEVAIHFSFTLDLQSTIVDLMQEQDSGVTLWLAYLSASIWLQNFWCLNKDLRIHNGLSVYTCCVNAVAFFGISWIISSLCVLIVFAETRVWVWLVLGWFLWNLDVQKCPVFGHCVRKRIVGMSQFWVQSSNVWRMIVPSPQPRPDDERF